MKTYKTLVLFALALVSAGPVRAQVPVAEEKPLVNQYIADSYEHRSAAWWNALGRQLTLLIDKPVDQVDVKALQNIIFFAHQHREKVNLNDAAPKLLTIYRDHERVEFRMMAMAALHAIAEEGTMRSLRQLVREEPAGTVRNMTVAALNAHYHER